MSIKDLDITAPADSQDINQGALRMRETRTAVQASFPNVGDAVTATSVQMNTTFVNGGWIVGMVIDWAPPSGWDGVVLPTGFAFADGETVNGFPTPDLRGMQVIGYDNVTAGHTPDSDYNAAYKTGGAKTRSVPLLQHNHTGTFSGGSIGSHTHSVGSHNHTMNHDHPAGTTSTDTHSHSTTIRTDGGGSEPAVVYGSSSSTWVYPSDSDSHNHTFDVANYSGSTGTKGAVNTGSNGGHTISGSISIDNNGITSPTLDVRQPYLVLAKLVYVGPTVLA
jgi:hypothetical protein